LNKVIFALRIGLGQFFQLKNIYLTTIPFILSFIAITIFFFLSAYVALDIFAIFLNEAQGAEGQIDPNSQSGVDGVVSSIIKFTAINTILGIGLAKILISLLVYVGFFGIVTLLSSIFATFFIGFYTPSIIKRLQKEVYSDVALNSFSTPFSSIFFYIKIIIVFLSLFILLIPLFFIPLLNIFATLIPFFYLFTKMLNYDVATNVFSEDEFREYKQQRGDELFFTNLTLYFISAIPFLGAFVSVLYVLVIGNLYLDYKRDLARI